MVYTVAALGVLVVILAIATWHNGRLFERAQAERSKLLGENIALMEQRTALIQQRIAMVQTIELQAEAFEFIADLVSRRPPRRRWLAIARTVGQVALDRNLTRVRLEKFLDLSNARGLPKQYRGRA